MERTEENLTREEARERAARLADLRYEVELDVADPEQLWSRSVVRFRADGTAPTFVDLTAREVRRATLNGVPLDTGTHTGTRLPLPRLQHENLLEVEAVHAYSNEGMGMHDFTDPVDGARYLHTQFEPFDAHRVFACFDQPDLKGRFRFTVTAPSDWRVVSNARPAAEERDGDGAPPRRPHVRVWCFAETPPLSTYVTAVVAGPYHAVLDRHRDVDLGLYCRESLARHLDPDELFELTRQGLDFFEEAFGLAYPFDKYDQLFVPEFAAGAMENPGCVTFNEMYVFRSKVTEASREARAETLLHEMAHMWFGDLVTMRWFGDLWLNESFASFMATLAQSRATRFRDAWVTFSDQWKAWAKYEDQLPTTHPVEADVPDVEAVHQNFDGITYAKGASVLRQLVAWVGEREFLAGCRNYFARHAYGNATLADLLRELEQTSGRDLAAWSEMWLRTAGINTLAARPEVAAGHYRRFVIEQRATEAHPVLRDHRVRVGLYDRREQRLVRRRQVELDVTGAHTDVAELVGEPEAEVVLVNDDDLAFAKLELDPTSLRTLTDHLHAIDDPLARALAWGTTWDMVRDATLAPRRYAETVHTNVHGETDIGLLQTLLRRLRAVIELYGDPAGRDELRRTAAARAWRAVDACAPGGDEQLAWVRHFAECARTHEDADRVRGLLAGDVAPPGLTVDTDLRWHLVRCLVTANAVGDDVVAEQLARDPSDLGERNAATARASRPEPDAKAWTWKQLVEDTSLSHSMATALMRGFQRPDQPEVLAPYLDRYVEVLPRVWSQRNLEWAIDFSRLMYPHALAGPELLARTDELLARDDLQRPLRRVLLEERDTVHRVLAARERDAA